MGIFSSDKTISLYNESVEPEYGYYGSDACAKIKLECYQNDMILFTSIIESDFESEKAKQKGLIEESSIITESTIGDIFNKIKEMIKKLWAKIKGLLQSFLTKFVAVFIRDNKQLVKKFHKQIMKQMTDSKRKYDEMTFKMHEGFYSLLSEKKGPGVNISDVVDYAKDEGDFSIASYGFVKQSLEQLKETFDNDYVDELNHKYAIKMSEISELKKELDDKYVGTIEDYEGYTSSLNSSVESELQSASKTKKDVEHNQREIDSKFRSYLKEIESDRKTAENREVGEPAEGKITQNKKDSMIKLANIKYYIATKVQTTTSEITTWYLSYLKSYFKEVRSLYIKAAARRQMKESADINVLNDIIDEAVAYDIDSIYYEVI